MARPTRRFTLDQAKDLIFADEYSDCEDIDLGEDHDGPAEDESEDDYEYYDCEIDETPCPSVSEIDSHRL